MANLEPNKSTRFSADKQPKGKRGRPKSIFGPLARENDLSLDDIRRIYKNILTTDPKELFNVIKKYPTSFTIATVGMYQQELRGTLTGRHTTEEEEYVDDDGKRQVKVKKVPERVKSYDMTKYMLDRIFGKPVENMDIKATGVDVTEMDKEERDQFIKAYLNKIEKKDGTQ